MTYEEAVIRNFFARWFDPDEKELRALFPLTLKERVRRIWVRLYPHQAPTKGIWFKPIWWTFFFGGTNDNGNGSTWRPNLIRRILRGFKHWKIKRDEFNYWQRHFEKYGCEEGPQTMCSHDNGETWEDATPL